MTEKKTVFLVKSMLSRTTNLNNPTDVIYRCAGLAYRDMLTAGRFYLSNNKEDVCDRFIELLNKAEYRFSRKLIDDTTKLFGDNEKIGRENRYVTKYGLAQKLVNMMFKYLYVFSDYIDKDIDFSKCDCPLDSVILGHFPEIKIFWSKITPAEYKKCQDRIRDKLSEMPDLDSEMKSLGNLAFDFVVW